MVFELETLIAALLVQAANTAAWAIRAVWKDWQRRRDQRHELKLREHELALHEQETRRQAMNQGIQRGYDISGVHGFNLYSPFGREYWRRRDMQRGQRSANGGNASGAR